MRRLNLNVNIFEEDLTQDNSSKKKKSKSDQQLTRDRSYSSMDSTLYKKTICPQTPQFRPIKQPENLPPEDISLPPSLFQETFKIPLFSIQELENDQQLITPNFNTCKTKQFFNDSDINQAINNQYTILKQQQLTQQQPIEKEQVFETLILGSEKIPVNEKQSVTKADGEHEHIKSNDTQNGDVVRKKVKQAENSVFFSTESSRINSLVENESTQIFSFQINSSANLNLQSSQDVPQNDENNKKIINPFVGDLNDNNDNQNSNNLIQKTQMIQIKRMRSQSEYLPTNGNNKRKSIIEIIDRQLREKTQEQHKLCLINYQILQIPLKQENNSTFMVEK